MNKYTNRQIPSIFLFPDSILQESKRKAVGVLFVMLNVCTWSGMILHPPPSAARSCAGHSRSWCCWPRPCCPPSPAAACCWRCRGAPAATPCPAQSATQEVVFTRSTGGAEIRENFTIFWEQICKWDTFCPSSKLIINRQLRLCLPTLHWWLTLWTIIPI